MQLWPKIQWERIGGGQMNRHITACAHGCMQALILQLLLQLHGLRLPLEASRCAMMMAGVFLQRHCDNNDICYATPDPAGLLSRTDLRSSVISEGNSLYP